MGVWVYFYALIQFIGCIFLFQCQYHTILMAISIWCSLKSGSLIPQNLLFFCTIPLAIWGLFVFQNCKVFIYFLFFGCTYGEFSLLIWRIALSRIFSLMILISIQEHSIYHHLFVLSLISLISIL